MPESSLATISIEYCAPCAEMLRAIKATEELLIEFEDQIEKITLIPSGDSVFEVAVNGTLVFSKMRLGRHPEDGEVIRKVGGQLSR
jgi:selT/selW/selH-like putative selenoprotein